jgi:hypothetical protein
MISAPDTKVGAKHFALQHIVAVWVRGTEVFIDTVSTQDDPDTFRYNTPEEASQECQKLLDALNKYYVAAL